MTSSPKARSAGLALSTKTLPFTPAWRPPQAFFTSWSQAYMEGLAKTVGILRFPLGQHLSHMAGMALAMEWDVLSCAKLRDCQIEVAPLALHSPPLAADQDCFSFCPHLVCRWVGWGPWCTLSRSTLGQ